MSLFPLDKIQKRNASGFDLNGIISSKRKRNFLIGMQESAVFW